MPPIIYLGYVCTRYTTRCLHMCRYNLDIEQRCSKPSKNSIGELKFIADPTDVVKKRGAHMAEMQRWIIIVGRSATFKSQPVSVWNSHMGFSDPYVSIHRPRAVCLAPFFIIIQFHASRSPTITFARSYITACRVEHSAHDLFVCWQNVKLPSSLLHDTNTSAKGGKVFSFVGLFVCLSFNKASKMWTDFRESW